ncbi:type VI secretion system membrane subunit TssM [Belnapia sp. T6]|uniref:Type VI secretion system membrane subunit TssM n=1 Tax=Belnapia mucosa TaxID=2804532 RepID=A0ABS1VD55_9PROT|nr:type VI secretion system membrane subunit TssM [Belnapia mucosa]MBL6458659.1 type VI secretion system membrane subunit TssM [Belnapia mucosa]
MTPLAAPSLLSALRAPSWVWTLAGTAMLALLVWLFGDLLGLGNAHPLASPEARLLAILGIALAWGAWTLVQRVRARRANGRMAAALATQATTGGDGPAGSAELAEIERRFVQALGRLKRRRLGRRGNRRWLYELPWYVMVGPPGSGKSTALAQAGLSLRLGQIQELRGIGGTRYCDWVFTDEAVLIDTAGRYVTQDSDPQADQTAWLGLLDLLRRQRPWRPLNGILVTLSVRDLLEGDGVGGSTDHAARIRARLEEIEERLGLRLPVYLLVTKVDLVSGFEPFFADLTEAQCEQVWGHTFRHDAPRAGAPPAPAELRQALAGLVERLDRRVPGRLAEEQDLERRALIFGFPTQVAGLAEAIQRFAERCFRDSAYERGAWLRGVYLTSGTQAGTPIDRLMDLVARGLGGTSAAPTATAAAGGERSFFLRHLLEQVVFGEAELAGRDLARERRERLLRRAVLASLALLLAGTGAAWGWSFAANRARQAATEEALGTWAQQARPQALPSLTAADADVAAVLPLLDRMAGIRARFGDEDPIPMRLGLSQRVTGEAQLGAAYRTALARLLLPRLMLAAEARLRVRPLPAGELVDGLRAYLSLVGLAPAETSLIEAFFAREATLRSAAAVASARRHLAALAGILPELDASERPAPDGRLLAELRAALAEVSLPRRAYEALLADPEASGLPEWRLTEHAGPNAAIAFVRHSRRPLGAGIPGIFTHAGFHRVFLRKLGEVARAVDAEFQVVGARAAPEAPDAEIRTLQADMLRLYYDDAVARWHGLLQDLAPVPLTGLDQAIEVTKALSGPSSPLKLLLRAVLRETALTFPPEPTREGAQPADAEGRQAATRIGSGSGGGTGGTRRLLLLDRAAGEAAELPGAPVEARFAYLRPLVEGLDGAPPTLDEALLALAALHARLAEVAAAPNPREAFARLGPGIAEPLGPFARRLPEPARPVIESVQKGVADLGKSGARQQLNALWRTEVLEFCRKATGGRFPFAVGGKADAMADDLARLFGPAGLIDSFVKGPLAAYVDTTRPTWADTQGIGLAPGSLAQLAQARRVAATLFGASPGQKASFSLVPVSLGGTALSATLDLDGQELRYDHGPARPVSFVWPGPAGTGTVRLSFAPASGGPPVTVARDGPWALLRLLHESGRLERTGQPEVFQAELGAGGHLLRLRLRAASVENPFDLAVFSRFACPDTLVAAAAGSTGR